MWTKKIKRAEMSTGGRGQRKIGEEKTAKLTDCWQVLLTEAIISKLLYFRKFTSQQ